MGKTKAEKARAEGGKETGKAQKHILGKVCSATGTLLIVLVIILCSLLVLPGFFGYHMYHVLSGSMEPEMPVGSLIYAKEGPPESVEAEDVIAFYGSLEDSGIITHRVLKNNIVSGTFRTKGDANEEEDPLPIPYENYIGKVALTVPYMGMVLTCMTSLYGKLAAVGVILLGLLLNMAGSYRTKR
ncbi:MAG: signal peptidase I [Lachnospiraceae bacterium]|nr:signal peptidase I [Lachnospiraceae bacterium]